MDGFGRGSRPEYFVPGVGADLREFEFLVVGVHLADLFAGGCAEDFDDFDELVHARVAWKYWLAQQELG